MSGYCALCKKDAFDSIVMNVCRDCFVRCKINSKNRPKIVCLCGSTKFKDAYIEQTRKETLKGNIVLSVGLFGHIEGLDMDGDTKKMLDELHLRKIDLADEILFLNVGGYIGQSTRNELQYAKSNNKTIRFLEKNNE